MKNITDSLKDVINNDITNLVRCWKLTTKRNEEIGFTTASEDFEYDGALFNSLSADDVSDLTANLDVENDLLKVSSLINSELITANDVLSGKYDGAKVEIFVVDLLNLDKGRVSLLSGRISDIKFKDNMFVASVMGLKNEIDRTIGEVYSPLCRASLCDKRCGLNRADYTYFGEISNVINDTNFATESETIINKNDDFFENGVVEFMGGENAGQKMEIKQFNKGVFMLVDELPYHLKQGDTFKAIAGCDKHFKTCCNRFNNAVNFRGEPHLPGIEILLKVM